MKLILARFLLIVAFALTAATAWAGSFQLSYSGRLVDQAGKPLNGSVDLQLKFYSHPTDPTLIAVTIPVFEDVILANGMFHVTLNLTGSEYQTAFGAGGDVWIETKDATHNKTYPRQQFLAVPYALQVPVDGVTIHFNTAGELEALTGGSGDMSKSQYDTDAVTIDSVDLADHATTADNATNADSADDSALLNGNAGSFYSNAANLTGTVPYARLPVGTAANTVAAGDDARFSNSRSPTGAAGGGLAGTYPNPTVASVPDAALSAAVSILGPSIDLASEVSGTLADGSLSGNVTKLGSAISLDNAETIGVLTVDKGGTGVGTLTGLVKGNGTGAFTAATLADVPVGYRLNASDGNPTDAVIVDAAGNVGVGTSGPVARLNVAAPSGPMLQLTNSLNDDSRLGSIVSYRAGPARTVDVFRDDGSTSFTLGSSGVWMIQGVNTQFNSATSLSGWGNPMQFREFSAGVAAPIVLQNDGNATDGAGTELRFAANRLASGMTNAAAVAGIITDTTDTAYKGVLTFKTADNAAPAERMRIDHAGNVGISTTTPVAKLDVAGEVKLGSTAAACSATNAGALRYDTANNRIQVCVTVNGSSYAWTTLNGQITSNLTLTVADPALTGGNDCDLIQQKLDLLDSYLISRAVLVTIALPDGTYNCSTHVTVLHPDGQRIQIIGNVTTPTNVEIVVTDADAFRIHANGLALLNGMRITGAGTAAGFVAIRVTDALATLGTKVQIRDFDDSGSYGLIVQNNSTLNVSGANVTDYLTMTNVRNAILATANSSFSGPYTRATGTSTAAGAGFSASANSYLYAPYSQSSTFYYCYVFSDLGKGELASSAASSCTYSFLATRSAQITATNSSAVGYMTNGVGYHASQGSSIECVSCVANGNVGTADTGFYADYKSVVYANSSTSQNNATGYYASTSGYISATSVTVSGNTTNYLPAINTTGTRGEMVGN